MKRFAWLAAGALISFTLGVGFAGAQQAAPAAPAAPAKPAPPPPPPTYDTFEFKALGPGAQVPDLPLKDLDGKAAGLGKALKPGLNVLMFTNSTCAACRNEAGLLAGIKGKLKEKLNVIGILTDVSNRGYTSLDKGVQDAFTFLHDPEFKTPSVFGFEFTPAMVLIKDGKWIDSKGGFTAGKDEKGITEMITKNL